MECRKLPRGKEEINVLGLGTSSIGRASEKEIAETVVLALENNRDAIISQDGIGQTNILCRFRPYAIALLYIAWHITKLFTRAYGSHP